MTMSTLLEQVDRVLQAGQPVCLAILVATAGSTPRKPGVSMLFMSDGTHCGSLGGSGIESQVRQRCVALLSDSMPFRGAENTEPLTGVNSWQRILTIDLAGEDSSACGGRMSVLVDLVLPGEDLGYFHTLRNELAAGRGCTEAIILDSQQANIGAPGDRLLLNRDGVLIAQRQAVAVRNQFDHLFSLLKSLAERPRPYAERGVSFLPHLPTPRLIIVGTGQVGQKVAALAAQVGFPITIVEDRAQLCGPERFPTTSRLNMSAFVTALESLQVDADSYCLIVTRGHLQDEQALYHLAGTAARYVGMIGSRRKIERVFRNLMQRGIPRESLERVYAPVGLEIGSQTPDEIAISIVAELIAHRNLGSIPDQFRPRPTAGPVLLPHGEPSAESDEVAATV